MKKKQAISLIVLVITIIVMIILAGAIILTLSNNGIIGNASNAVEEYNLDELNSLASMIWADAYLNSETKLTSDIRDKVLEGLENNNVELDKYNVRVTNKGVKITLKGAWITAMVDGVPIPKGFAASSATGENTKDGGLVIYEGTDPVTNENVEDAKRERNQYVWVPVEDFTKFVRTDYTNNPSKIVDENGNYNALGTSVWEVLVNNKTNLPLDVQDLNYMTTTTLAEVQEMYASVKEYKGFYIARYEMGVDTQRTLDSTVIETKVYSMMGKIPYTFVPWTLNNNIAEDANGLVEVARSVYTEMNRNYGVVSTLTYGVQWDRTLAWWLEVKAKDGKGNIVTSVTDSTSYGNYINHVVAAGDLNEGAKYAVDNRTTATWEPYKELTADSTKASGEYWLLTTGALKVASVNNIYDMAGNIIEATMEGASSTYRVERGGYFALEGDKYSAASRNARIIDGVYSSNGCRAALYIKL